MKDFSNKARKAPIAIIDGDEAHRTQMAEALGAFYAVSAFDDGSRAVGTIMADVPEVVIVDENVQPAGGLSVLRRMKDMPALMDVPVICTSRDPNAETGFFAEARGMGFDKGMAKPVKFKRLVTAISESINGAIEKAWDEIEPVQREALKKTVSVFNSISDIIDSGEPLPYGEVKESCGPLVTAVQNNQYKEMLRSVRGHDDYSYVHSLRVATFLSLFGHTIGIKGDDLMMLSTGGLVHDIGKMSIPNEVLNKPGRLEGDEWATMQSHVSRTLAALENSSDIPHAVITVAAQHHEKLDGSGYPKGLKGKELNDLARMATIVDIFGALTDRRCYKDPMPPEKALDIMTDMVGALDMQLLVLFREMLLDATSE